MGAVPLYLFVILTASLPRLTAGISCLQCNVFARGILNTCDDPLIMPGCFSCLKTLTKISMHDRWGDQKISEVVSRYCIIESSTALYQDEGCYLQRNNGGYTKRCYCYSDNCNAGMTLRPWMTLLTVVFARVVFQ